MASCMLEQCSGLCLYLLLWVLNIRLQFSQGMLHVPPTVTDIPDLSSSSK